VCPAKKTGTPKRQRKASSNEEALESDGDNDLAIQMREIREQEAKLLRLKEELQKKLKLKANKKQKTFRS